MPNWLENQVTIAHFCALVEQLAQTIFASIKKTYASFDGILTMQNLLGWSS